MEQRDVIDQCRSPPPCHCLAAGAGGAHERRSASAMRAASAVSKARSTRNSTSASSGQEGGGQMVGTKRAKKGAGGEHLCACVRTRGARVRRGGAGGEWQSIAGKDAGGVGWGRERRKSYGVGLGAL